MRERAVTGQGWTCAPVRRATTGGVRAVSSPNRPRVLLGVHVTVQAVLLVCVALGLTTLVGMAVLSWLESTA